MPCNSEMRGPSGEYSSRDMELKNDKIRNLEKNNQWFGAALCALINHLDSHLELDVEAQLMIAGESGEVDLKGFWNKHKHDDRVRLEEQLIKAFFKRRIKANERNS